MSVIFFFVQYILGTALHLAVQVSAPAGFGQTKGRSGHSSSFVLFCLVHFRAHDKTTTPTPTLKTKNERAQKVLTFLNFQASQKLESKRMNEKDTADRGRVGTKRDRSKPLAGDDTSKSHRRVETIVTARRAAQHTTKTCAYVKKRKGACTDQAAAEAGDETMFVQTGKHEQFGACISAIVVKIVVRRVRRDKMELPPTMRERELVIGDVSRGCDKLANYRRRNLAVRRFGVVSIDRAFACENERAMMQE